MAAPAPAVTGESPPENDGRRGTRNGDNLQTSGQRKRYLGGFVVLWVVRRRTTGKGRRRLVLLDCFAGCCWLRFRHGLFQCGGRWEFGDSGGMCSGRVESIPRSFSGWWKINQPLLRY